MFKKILVANRGEIAVRIIRACKELGIKTIAVYSKIDSNSLHVKMADEKVCIGQGDVNKSYLNSYHILSTALLYGADAIHPGIGFFAENPTFSEMCENCNITYIGPNHKIMNLMSNKVTAKTIAMDCNIPVASGINTPIEDVTECANFAEKVGYPIIIKASAGGGGKGIRIVKKAADLEKEFLSCKKEALNAFGNSDVFVEKCLQEVNHVEIQILADSYGNIICLGERDCSIQRGNQKIIEETPCSFLTDELRKKMMHDAIMLGKHTGYVGAGTIEFLLDKDLNYYFMEMNTRIQVEHPITEMITGVDIVKEQIKVAAGEKLSISQKDININGHSIECRINSENPALNFMPSIGTINGLHIPTGLGIRVETALCLGYSCTPFYDSLIMKIIVHGKDRNEAINKMRIALAETEILGVTTNIPLHNLILTDNKFIQQKVDTGYVSKLDLTQLSQQS